jgi:hypothetical protein
LSIFLKVLTLQKVYKKMKKTIAAIALMAIILVGLQSCSGGSMYKSKDCFGQKPNNHKFQ